METVKCLHRDGDGHYTADEAVVEKAENGRYQVYMGNFAYPLGSGEITEIKGWGMMDGYGAEFRPEGCGWTMIIPLSEMERVGLPMQ